MRKLNSLKLLLSALLLTIGCNVWGEDPVYTLEFTKLTSGDNYSSYTAPHTYTSNGIGWSMYGNQSVGDNIRVGGKTTTATDRTLTSSATISASKDISKISITHSGIGNGKNTSITINSITVEGCTASTFASSKSKTITNPSVASAGTLEFSLDEGDWDANSYYKITVNYQVTITSGTTANNCYLTINDVKFYASEAPAKVLQSISVKTAPTTTTYTEGQSFAPAGLVIIANYGTDGTEDVAYSGNESKFTFSPALDAALTTSNNEVTVTYGGKSTTQAITVNALPAHTATFYSNGSVFDTETVKEGVAITFPAEDPADIDSKKFMGWAESTISGTTQTAPSFVTSATMGTGDKNFYAVFATVTGEEETDKIFYFEPFTGSAHSTGFASDNVAATQDMFSDKEATVWSHYIDTKAPSTTSYATNLDGSDMSNGIKIYQQINNMTKTILEVKGIDISNGKNLALSLYNRRSHTSATLIVEYKIDNAATYSSVGGTIKYSSTNDNWKYCDGLTISGTGSTLDLKISVKVTGTTNRIMLIDDVKLYGKHGGVTYSDYCTTIPYTLTTADNDFYSLYLPFDAEIPDNVDVYTGELDANETTLTLHEVTGTIPAETAVLVKSPSTTGDFVFKYASETQDPLTNNSLKGVLVDTKYDDLAEDGKTLLTLNTREHVVGFYLPKEGATTLKANRAYLLVTTPKNPAPVRIVMPNDVATAIENNSEAVKANKTLIDGRLYILRDGNMFDLNGRLVK